MNDRFLLNGTWRFFLIGLFLLLNLRVVCQNISVLEAALEHLPENTEKVDVSMKIGVHYRNINSTKSISYLESAVQIAEKINYPEGVSNACLELSITCLSAKRLRKTLEALEKGLPYARKIGDQDVILDYYQMFEQVHSRRGDFTLSRQFQNKYLALQDSLNQKKNDEKIDLLNEQLDQEKAFGEQILHDLESQQEISLRKQLEISKLQIETAELERARLEEAQLRLQQEMQAASNEALLGKKIRNRDRMIFLTGIALLVCLGFLQRYRFVRQRRKAAFEAEKSNRLEEIDRLKDQFLANTSHELKTPLMGIIGIAESMVDEALSYGNDAQVKDLSLIISSGKRLNNLVNDILDFAKIRNDEIQLQVKPVDLHSATDVVFHVYRSIADEKNIVLQNQIPADLPAVLADENRLQQILHNLVDNSIKFSKNKPVTVSAKINDEFIEISVEDHGIGISPENQRIIFHEFKQADGSASRSSNGSGLGLSISKKLIELQGGEITLESELDVGSTFTITLPIADEKVIQSQKTEDKVSSLVQVKPIVNPIKLPADILKADYPKNKPLNILIVDDEPVNQHVLKKHLAGNFYQIHSAMDGEEALQIINSDKKIDLVLLDIMMPRITGYEVCKKIREKYLASELPIIMITAKNQVSDLVEALSYGANDYLAKPFSKDEFLARIKTHMDLYNINSVTSRFVPNEFLRLLGYNTITDVKLGDYKEREITVFFSDIRAYTTLSESMDPQDNFKFVMAFVGRVGPSIRKFEGFVLQFLGDGMMALFLEDPTDAVHASIEIQHIVAKYNEERMAVGRKPISLGIGLHTGQMVMGIIGDEKRNNAATISDAVNTASRMESLTKFFNAKLLVSKETMDKMSSPGQFNTRYLGRVKAKGKTEIKDIFEVIDADIEFKDLKIITRDSFEEGLFAYLGKDFYLAIDKFNQVLEINSQDSVARQYLIKAKKLLREKPQENWTGVENITV